jgi:hypothetical protein
MEEKGKAITKEQETIKLPEGKKDDLLEKDLEKAAGGFADGSVRF